MSDLCLIGSTASMNLLLSRELQKGRHPQIEGDGLEFF
jgi:hypothetical protein